jgi:hypothetical protein
MTHRMFVAQQEWVNDWITQCDSTVHDRFAAHNNGTRVIDRAMRFTRAHSRDRGDSRVRGQRPCRCWSALCPRARLNSRRRAVRRGCARAVADWLHLCVNKRKNRPEQSTHQSPRRAQIARRQLRARSTTSSARAHHPGRARVSPRSPGV